VQGLRSCGVTAFCSSLPLFVGRWIGVQVCFCVCACEAGLSHLHTARHNAFSARGLPAHRPSRPGTSGPRAGKSQRTIPVSALHAKRYLQGCGFNPRPGSGASQVYSVAGSDLALIGTSEISIAGLHAGALLDRATLPALYAAVSHCFRRRREGAAGSRVVPPSPVYQGELIEGGAHLSQDAAP